MENVSLQELILRMMKMFISANLIANFVFIAEKSAIILMNIIEKVVLANIQIVTSAITDIKAVMNGLSEVTNEYNKRLFQRKR